MIYLLTILYTLADVMYSKYQFAGSNKWHSWRLVKVILFFAAFVCIVYFPFGWQDFLFCGVINMAMFPLLLNKIALHQKWLYVGSTSETDKKIGKYQWYSYTVLIVISAILKIFIKPKKSTL